MVVAMGAIAATTTTVLPIAAAYGETAHRQPTVGVEVPVTPMDLVRRPANNSPMLAVDPTDSRYVVVANRLDGPDFSCALQVSGDGGRGWASANPVPKLPEGAEKCYAPEVAFDRTGVLYYLFVGLAGRGNNPVGAFITTSTDHGRNFAPPRSVLGPERFMVRMAIDPSLGSRGRIHLVWVEAVGGTASSGFPPQPNPIMSAHSDDGGRTFSAPVQVSDGSRARVVAPAVVIGRHHAVHVLYYDLAGDVRDYEGLEGPTWEDKWVLVVASSTDSGGHFGPGVVVDAEVAPPERVMLIYTMPPPSIAADASSGHLYAAWHDVRNGDWDVFVRRSADGGRTWEPPVRVNDDAVGNHRNQYLPRLSVAPGGRLDIVWYDRRGNEVNRGNDVYYSYSGDGGRHFAPNVKLTSLDSDSRIGPRYLVTSARGLVEFGSRIALVSARSGATAAWTDTRNNGRGVTAQDIFSTTVDFGGGDGSGKVAPLAVGAVVVLLLAGAAMALRSSRRRRTPGHDQTGAGVTA